MSRKAEWRVCLRPSVLRASLVEWLGVHSRGHQCLTPTVSSWGEAVPCWEVWGPGRGTTHSPHLMGHLRPAHCPLPTRSDLGISSIPASGLGLQSPQWEAGSLPVQLVALKDIICQRGDGIQEPKATERRGQYSVHNRR